MILNIAKFDELLKTLEKRLEKEALIYFVSQEVQLSEALKSKEELEKLMEGFKEWTKSRLESGLTDVSYTIDEDEEYSSNSLTIKCSKFGLILETTFDTDFADSSEWAELKNLWNNMSIISSLPVKVKMENGEREFDDYLVFRDYILEMSKKGMYIQRYKGLGEMNPEQLWDTTLNPENRNLLRVTIGRCHGCG